MGGLTADLGCAKCSFLLGGKTRWTFLFMTFWMSSRSSSWSAMANRPNSLVFLVDGELITGGDAVVLIDAHEVFVEMPNRYRGEKEEG